MMCSFSAHFRKNNNVAILCPHNQPANQQQVVAWKRRQCQGNDTVPASRISETSNEQTEMASCEKQKLHSEKLTYGQVQHIRPSQIIRKLTQSRAVMSSGTRALLEAIRAHARGPILPRSRLGMRGSLTWKSLLKKLIWKCF